MLAYFSEGGIGNHGKLFRLLSSFCIFTKLNKTAASVQNSCQCAESEKGSLSHTGCFLENSQRAVLGYVGHFAVICHKLFVNR